MSIKLSDNSGYYELEIIVYDVNKKDFKLVQLAVKNIWDFSEWLGCEKKIFSHGIGFIDEKQTSQQDLAEAMASAIWNRTGKYYKIELDFSRLKKLKPKTVVMDESNFVRLCLRGM